MRASMLETRGRWIIASAGGVAVMVGVLMLFRLPPASTALPIALTPPTPKAALTMARPDDSDRLLKEEAQLRDLRPLFLPTERNAALPDPRLEPGRTFLDDEAANFTFTDAEAHITKDLPPVVRLGGQPVEKALPADALSPAEAGITVEGFGRGQVSLTPFQPRGGYVEVTAMKDGERILEQKLPVDARPPGDKSWGPVEYLAVVDAAGLVSPLVVTSGSRVDEVDSYFRDFLAQNFRIGERLSPGFYRIIVAP
jgi:hypothetical protein